MTRFLGTSDLGLKVEWRFRFAGYGEKVPPTPGVVYVDVGGALQPGVLDHHGGDQDDECAAALVLHNRSLVYNHLMSPWLERWEEGRLTSDTEWSPTVITHESPDFDGVVAIHLITRLIADGDFPDYAPALVSYASEVDQGRYQFRPDEPGALTALHIAYLALQNLQGPNKRFLPWEEQVTRGLALLERVVRDVGQAPDRKGPWERTDFLPGRPGTGAWTADENFADIHALLAAEPEKFQRDREAATVRDDVFLPSAADGEPMQVRTFIADRPTESVLNKYWVRAMGCPYFICPYGASGQSPGAEGSASEIIFPRVILSIDPTFSVRERRPSLRGLGYALEKEELVCRTRDGGHDDRGGAPRYPDGYCANSDPWYDGRGHDHTIVDAPRGGTILPYATVVDIATTARFWKIPLEFGAVRLVWVGRNAGAPGDAVSKLKEFPEMAATIKSLFGEIRQHSSPLPGSPPALPSGISLTTTVRHYPRATCPPFRIVDILAGPGVALEELVSCRGILQGVMEKEPPDYSISHIVPGIHFSEPAVLTRLSLALGGASLAQAGAVHADGDALLIGGRNLVHVLSPAPPSTDLLESDREVLLYCAFLYESLMAMTGRLADLVKPGTLRLTLGATKTLREDFLRFQARYYQLEASRSPRGRDLFATLSTTLKLPGHYAEVQLELSRLAEVESQMAAERRSRAERLLQGTIYFLSVSGLIQAIIALLGWQKVDPGMWGWIAPVLSLTALIYALILWLSRDR